MDLIAEKRSGNRVFKITFPTGECIHFRLFSWKHFNDYWELTQKGIIPNDIIEDVIFRECCLDPVILDNIYDMRAGIVSTIVGIIMNMCGPTGIDSFNNDMDIVRESVDTLNSQIVMVICRAFPAYRPEDIMDMSWSDVLLRLAQAERILMKKVPPELTEPIRMVTNEEQEGYGQVDVKQLVKEGRQDAGQMGLRSDEHGQLTQLDLDMGQKAMEIRAARRAMARRFRE